MMEMTHEMWYDEIYSIDGDRLVPHILLIYRKAESGHSRKNTSIVERRELSVCKMIRV